MASAAQQELSSKIKDLAQKGIGAGCTALDKKLPGSKAVCDALGKSATDIFQAFTVIEDKAAELGGASAAALLEKELEGQWGSLTLDITKDLGVCVSNSNTGSCGGRTAARVAKAFLKIRPLNKGDSQPGTTPKLGQLTPVMIPYAKAVLFAAFGNNSRANAAWALYTKNLAAYEKTSPAVLQLAQVEEKIVMVAQQLQQSWTEAKWSELKVLKAKQAELKKQLGQKPPASLAAAFVPQIKQSTLDKIKEQKAAEDAKDDIQISPAAIGAGAGVLALLKLFGA